MATTHLVTLLATLALIAGAAWAANAHGALAPGSKPPVFFGMARPPASKPYVEGEMLVKFKDGVTPEQIAAFNAETGCKIADTVAGLGIYRLRLPEGVDVPEMVARYQASELVAFAEPNHRVSIPSLPGPKPGQPQPRSGGLSIMPAVQSVDGELTP